MVDHITGAVRMMAKTQQDVGRSRRGNEVEWLWEKQIKQIKT